MARGEGQSVDDRLQNALDVCLAQLRRGDDPERCLSEYPDLADELRPLLELAGTMLASHVDPPAAPSGLAAPRDRLMAAARATLSDSSASSEVNPGEADLRLSPAADAALDVCLTRIKSGEDMGRVVADFPDFETQLTPILELAAQIQPEIQAPPPPPQGLESARQHFLSAANQMREQNLELDEAVDLAVARALSGDAAAESVSAQPTVEEALVPLAELAAQMSADRVAVPPPPTGLAHARQRFVAASDAARANAAAEAAAAVAAGDARGEAGGSSPIGFIDRLSEWLAPARPSAMPRVAVVAVAVLLALVVGATSLSPSVEAAIPGDVLYPVKRAGEDIRLLITRDDSQRQALLELHSARRDREITAATAAGVVADVSWQVRLEGLGGGAESPRLVVWLLSASGDGGALRELEMGPNTSWILGRLYDRIDDVPTGSVLRIVVRTQPSDPNGLPLAIRVELLEPAELESVSDDGSEPQTADSRPEIVTGRQPTTPITPAPSPTRSVVPAASTAIPALSATATAAPMTMTPAPAPVVVREATQDKSLGLLRGILDERVDDATWMVSDVDQGGVLIHVDVRELSAREREIAEHGDGIDLYGRWLSADHRKFATWEMTDYIAEPDVCQDLSATGTVEEYKPGSFLVLSDNREYLMSGVSDNSVGGVAPLAVGAEVSIKYRDCRGLKVVLEITVLRGAGGPARGTGTARPPGVPYQGTVEHLVEPGEFLLLGDDGNLYTVLYGPETPITGKADTIRWQQEIGVIGWLEGNQITAQSIEIYADAPPTATPQPSPTPTTGAMGPPVTPPSVPTVMLPGSETG